MTRPAWYRRVIEYFGLDAISDAKRNRETRADQARELEALRREVDQLRAEMDDVRSWDRR